MAKTVYDRCIFFLVDGAREDVMREMTEAGELPALRRYVLDRGDYRKAVTSFPSTTGPAHVPFLTGCTPGSCNLPGIRWFDRSQPNGLTHFRQARSYVGPGGLYIDQDLKDDIHTIFEYFERPAGVFSFVNKGLGIFENRTLLTRGWYWLYAHYSGQWQAVDDAAWRYIDRAVDQGADFLSVVFPAVDEYSHYTDPFSDATLNAYRKFDRGLGRLAERLQRQDRLDGTLFVISSDHGLTSTHTHFELWSFLDELGFNTLYYPRILRNGCDAATMVSGNGMAHIYLKKGDSWEERPSYEEIRTLGETDPIEALLGQEAIDLVAAVQDDSVIVCGRRGISEIKETPDGIAYRVIEGKDPFGYGGIPAEASDEQLLSATFDTDYPDAPYQLLRVLGSPRSGDLIVSARKGYDLRYRYEHPEHKSTHGSLHRDHMHVPLMMNTEIAADHVRTVDLFPAMLNLTGRLVEGTIDGRDSVTAASRAVA